MISISRIKEYLDDSDNPLIFFDDDTDGLASFLLIRKYLDKGKGIPVKHNIVDESYLKAVSYYSPDLILVLDKHGISQEFVDKVNVPIVWIDHHPIKDIKGVKHFNPLYFDKNDSRPTSYWCYQITKENLWIAATGIIGDWRLDYYDEFCEKYKDLGDAKLKEPPDVLFKTRIGELAKLFTFILHGKTQEVKQSINILTRINDPYEILDRTTPRGKFIYKRFERSNNEYKRILHDAIKNSIVYKKIFLYTYTLKDSSYTTILANELIYKNPDKVVVIAREKDGRMKMSLRSYYKGDIILPKLIDKAILGLNGKSGGHDHACGGEIDKEDFKTFIDKLEHLLK